MTTTLDQAFDAYLDLAHNFREHRTKFLDVHYQEAEVRKDFLDPFFIALGWDVNHQLQKNPWEQEVKVERTVDVELAQKKADYAFYLAPRYQQIRFYVEAKKPSVVVKSSVDAHFQTVRYGWSANTPFAILTNFDTFVVLDCRRRPAPATVLAQAHLVFSFEELCDSELFAKFYWLFSREAIESGAFDRYVRALATSRKSGNRKQVVVGEIQCVDDSFLQDLEAHRESLAKIYKKADITLTSSDLTEMTQRTIDRLVFLRFLEDKLIETQLRVADFGGRRDAWHDFLDASTQLDATYNGIVFKPHQKLDRSNLPVNPEAFLKVCSSFSHSYSPYNFNAIPIHILGSIYEQFLGKVVVATNKRVRLEEKPEVRKAGGVFYTPEYIVSRIVVSTVGVQIEGKEPKDVWAMKFADPACGSGSFLLGVYDYLLSYLERWYNGAGADESEKSDRNAKAKNHGCILNDNGVWRLGLKLRRDILVKCIFGVDIDSQAVEVSQLSLFLKLLENESTATAHQFKMDLGGGRALKMLPNLSGNIVCGNSLVDWDVQVRQLSDEDEKLLNPLSYKDTFEEVFRNGGFDAVVGNPPYVDSEWMTRHSPLLRAYCTEKYGAASGNWDLFCVFVERTLQICKPGGFVSLILPNKLGSANYASGARKVLIENKLVSISDYSKVPVFPVAVYPIVYCAQKQPPPASHLVEYERYEATEDGRYEVLAPAFLSYDSHFMPPGATWTIFSSLDGAAICQRLVGSNSTLGDIATVTGAATVTEAYAIADLLQDGGQGLRMVNSGTIDPYILRWGAKDCRYLKKVYAEPTISKENQKHLPQKRLAQALTPKIIIAGMTKALECGLDAKGEYLAGKSTSIVFWDGELEYLIGILNSRLVNFFYDTQYGGDRLQGGYLRIGPPQLKEIPIRVVDATNPADIRLAAEVKTSVGVAIDARRNEQCATNDADRLRFGRKAKAAERRIDELVYALYGITPAEVIVIEASVK